MPRKKSKPAGAKRRPGAQPGNKNAEKHGFYSKRFNPDETNRLDTTDRLSIESEIDLVRVYIDRIAAIVNISRNISDDDLKALNTLANMTQSLSTMLRTHYLMRGKGGEIEKTIMQALEEVRLELGI